MDLVFKIIDFFKKVNKKYIILIGLCVVLSGLLIWYGLSKGEEPNPEYNVVNKAQVAKSVSMIFHSLEEINDNESNEFQGQEVVWYQKYMNMMYKDGYYSTKDIQPIEREAVEVFTYGDLKKLYTNMGVVDKELQSYVKNNRENSPVILKDWNEIYSLMVQKLDIDDKIEKVNLIISGTISKDASLSQWTAATTYGKLGFEGLSVDYYIDKGITVFVKDNEILGVTEVYSEDVTYHNSWIISMSGGNIKAYVEGCVREFVYNDNSMLFIETVFEDVNGFLNGTYILILDNASYNRVIESLGAYTFSFDERYTGVSAPLREVKLPDNITNIFLPFNSSKSIICLDA